MPQTGKGAYFSKKFPEHQGLESEALGVKAIASWGCPGPFPQELRTHVLSVLLAALIPGERTEREEGLWVWMPPFLSSLCYHSISALGYWWPRKGHWASAGFWWSSLKRDVSTDLVSFKRTLLYVAQEWGWGRNGGSSQLEFRNFTSPDRKPLKR